MRRLVPTHHICIIGFRDRALTSTDYDSLEGTVINSTERTPVQRSVQFFVCLFLQKYSFGKYFMFPLSKNCFSSVTVTTTLNGYSDYKNFETFEVTPYET